MNDILEPLIISIHGDNDSSSHSSQDDYRLSAVIVLMFPMVLSYFWIKMWKIFLVKKIKIRRRGSSKQIFYKHVQLFLFEILKKRIQESILNIG